MKAQILLISAFLLLASQAGAQTVTTGFQAGPSGYSGTRDTWILEGAGFRGDEPGLHITSWGWNVLVGFDGIFGPAAGQIPVGSTIESAKLTLGYSDHHGQLNHGSWEFSLYEMLVAWNDATTWEDLGSGVQIGTETPVQPVDVITDADLGGFPFFQPSGKISESPDGSISFFHFDVTPSLQLWAQDPGANEGWYLDLTASNLSNSFLSSNQPASSRAFLEGWTPSLEVTFSSGAAVIPEPATLGMAGLALLGVWIGWRRRSA